MSMNLLVSTLHSYIGVNVPTSSMQVSHPGRGRPRPHVLAFISNHNSGEYLLNTSIVITVANSPSQSHPSPSPFHTVQRLENVG